MRTRPITDEAAKKSRQAAELARGTRFWLDVRESLDESRAGGISLAEAKRRLDERLAAEGTKRPAKRRSHRRSSAR
jgi:hypothetical protein